MANVSESTSNAAPKKMSAPGKAASFGWTFPPTRDRTILEKLKYASGRVTSTWGPPGSASTRSISALNDDAMTLDEADFPDDANLIAC